MKYLLSTLVAGALLLPAFTGLAQDTEPEESSEPEFVQRYYDVSDFLMRERSEGVINPVLGPRWFGQSLDFDDNDLDQWQLEYSGSEARCFDDEDDFEGIVDLMNPEGFEYDINDMHGKFGLKAPVALHERIGQALDALREISEARTNIAVWRLADNQINSGDKLTPDQVAKLSQSARLVGVANGGLGDRLTIQRTESRSFVADLDAETATGTSSIDPRMNELFTGDEFVFSGVKLVDGRVWLQGRIASRNLTKMNEATTSQGTIELPDTSYKFAPISTVFQNNAGVVVDLDHRRYLVRVNITGDLSDRKIKVGEYGEVHLLNVVHTQRGQDFSHEWFMEPNAERFVEDGIGLRQVFVDRYEDGPYHDAAIMAFERANNLGLDDCMEVFGPWLAVIDTTSEDWFEPEQHNALARVRNMLAPEGACATTNVRIRLIEAPNTMAMSAGVLAGLPSRAEIDALVAANDTTARLDSVSFARVGQRMEILNLRTVNMVADYDTILAAEVSIMDPVVRTQLLGQQVRWSASADRDGRLMVRLRAGFTHGPSEFEWINTGENNDLQIQRSRADLSQADISERLKKGEAACCVIPSASNPDTLFVLVVERIE